MSKSKTSIAVIAGVAYWILGIVLKYLDIPFVGVLVLIVAPILLGIFIGYILPGSSVKASIILILSIIILRQFLAEMRMFFTLGADGPFWIYESTKAFVLFSGPIEFFSAFVACIMVKKIRQHRSRGRS